MSNRLRMELPSPCSPLFVPLSGRVGDDCSAEGMTKMEKSLVNGRVMIVGFDHDRAEEFHDCRVWLGKENQHDQSFLMYIFDPDTNQVNVMPFSEMEQVELNKALFEVVVDMKDGRRFSFREDTDAEISEYFVIVNSHFGASSGPNSPARRKSSLKSMFGGVESGEKAEA